MRRSEETKKKFIRAALSLFARKGYQGTSTGEITRKVGPTRGALYSHISSKGDLLLRIVDVAMGRFIDEMIRAIAHSDGDALAKLHATISFSSKFAFENEDPCVFLAFLTTELKANVDPVPPLKNVYRGCQKFTSPLIRQGIHQGPIEKTIDPSLAALSFMALQNKDRPEISTSFSCMRFSHPATPLDTEGGDSKDFREPTSSFDIPCSIVIIRITVWLWP